MKLIVGLGNPGVRYEGTRHNVGFDTLDDLQKKLNLPDWETQKKFNSEVIKDGELILAKPQTFMNNSGEAVAKIARFFKIKPEDIIVVHDELDLPLSKLKVRIGGSAAGHHGVESVMEKIGTDKFIRVRMGIGNLKTKSSELEGGYDDTTKFVTEPFTPSERTKVKKMIKDGIKALELLLTEGLVTAQNQFN